jgi:hypothetical protein
MRAMGIAEYSIFRRGQQIIGASSKGFERLQGHVWGAGRISVPDARLVNLSLLDTPQKVLHAGHACGGPLSTVRRNVRNNREHPFLGVCVVRIIRRLALRRRSSLEKLTAFWDVENPNQCVSHIAFD